MKHVAQAAGVSVMTVSLAIRHDTSIPATTRDRILEIADRLGYRRNPLVSALMVELRGWHPRRQDAHVIAYVESYSAKKATTQQSGALTRFYSGATECAEKHGYRLEVFQMGEDGLSEARLETMLTARGIRGVVFAPFPMIDSRLNQSWENHALSTVGYSLAHPNVHRAVNHQLHSFRLAIIELVALGYKRIGVVMSRHADRRVERNWLSSVLLIHYENAGTGRTFPFLFEEKVSRQAVLAWLRENRPEVVVTTGDVAPTTLARAAGVGFVHLHLTPTLAGCTGIDQNNERVGAAAVDLVVEQVHSNRFGIPNNPKTVLIEGLWVPGETAPGPGRRRKVEPRIG